MACSSTSGRRLAALSLSSMLAAGASAQCANVADLTAGTTPNNNTDNLVDFFGERLFFTEVLPASGTELWQWEPVNGAQMVLDMAPGSLTSNPELLTPGTTPLGPRLFFSAFEIGHGHELYVSDGTAAGTHRLLEIRSGSSGSLPQRFCPVGDRMFFVANDGTNGNELWVSDGSAAGTQMLRDIFPGLGNSWPDHLCALGEVLLFSADDGVNGRELWISDGTPAGTQLLLDIVPGASSSSPFLLVRGGDHVYFGADQPATGVELWKTDGTAAGTTMVADLRPGFQGSLPIEYCPCGDRVFFIASTTTGTRLHVTDGTTGGTLSLGVFAGGALLEGAIVCSGDRVFVAGFDAVNGRELWVSDGTLAGTQLVADLVPGGGSSNPDEITAAGNGVFFTAQNTSTQLWFSDGTAAGTVPVCTPDPTQTYHLFDLTMSRGHLFFLGYDPNYGHEIFWVETPGASITTLGPPGRADHTTLAVRDGAPPVLGTAIDLVGKGPANQFGALLASPIVAPAPVPVVPGFVLGGTDWVGILAGTAIFAQGYNTPDTSWTFAIPNDPTWEGLVFRFQMLWWDPVGPVPYQLSNGLQLALGTAAPH